MPPALASWNIDALKAEDMQVLQPGLSKMHKSHIDAVLTLIIHFVRLNQIKSFGIDSSAH